MSFVTVMKGVVIKDVNAFIKTVDELIAQGLRGKLVQNQRPRVHGRDQVAVCDYVIKLEGAYDVGFKKNERGEYEPVFDVYQNHVGRSLGATHACAVPSGFEGQALTQLGKFSQLYAKNAALNQAAADGFMVDSVTEDAEGNLQLVLNTMSY